MLRALVVSSLAVFSLLTGCTSGDFKLVDQGGTSSLTVARGSSGSRNFTLQAEGHYLNTAFTVTSSATDADVTTTATPASVNTGSGSVDIGLEVSIPANFAGTSTFASIRVEDANDPQSFASNSITVVVQ